MNVRLKTEMLTEDGFKPVEFVLELSKLQKWMSDVGCIEPYDDIRRLLLKYSNGTVIHLQKPMNAVMVSMEKDSK